ncbi:c-type cytochrome [Legionella sp.]|uniref:c-type cytochrome n=1 Tax=Legionella sp. TaxID=459 RepID=UPI003CC0F8F5
MKLLGVMLSFFSFALYAGEITSQEIQLKTQRLGQVSMQSQPEAKNKAVTKLAKKKQGQKIYEQYCTVCHNQGLAGAPKFRNEQDWKQRRVSRTLNDLVTSSIKGLNAMPAKGTCFKCNEDDLKAAIAYMLPQS